MDWKVAYAVTKDILGNYEEKSFGEAGTILNEEVLLIEALINDLADFMNENVEATPLTKLMAFRINDILKKKGLL